MVNGPANPVGPADFAERALSIAPAPTTGRSGGSAGARGDTSPGGGGHRTGTTSSALAATGLPGSGLAEALNLDDILPYTPSVAAPAAPDAPPPAGQAPAGEAIADYGHGPQTHWAVISGLFVALAVLVLGRAILWWRNRDSTYWPA